MENMKIVKPTKRAPKYTQQQLSDAFDLVKNKKDWKEAIKQTVKNIDADKATLIVDAVLHFTGSECYADQIAPNTYKFTANGYYAAMDEMF